MKAADLGLIQLEEQKKSETFSLFDLAAAGLLGKVAAGGRRRGGIAVAVPAGAPRQALGRTILEA